MSKYSSKDNDELEELHFSIFLNENIECGRRNMLLRFESVDIKTLRKKV